MLFWFPVHRKDIGDSLQKTDQWLVGAQGWRVSPTHVSGVLSMGELQGEALGAD